MKILRNNTEDTVATRFQLDLEKTIIILNDRSKPSSRHYMPSSLNCLRKMYYIISGIETNRLPVSPELTRICENGTDSHLRLQYYVSNISKINPTVKWINVAEFVKEKGLTSLEIKYQKEFETHLYHRQLNISFMCDGLLKIGNEYYILEIKTESSTSFNKRTNIDNKHRFQAICYSALLHVPKVLFIYENRDICSKKYYTMEVTEEERNGIIYRIKTCDNMITMHQLPAKETSTGCSYCPYINHCRTEYNPLRLNKLF